MEKIINKENKQTEDILLHEISVQDMVIVGTKLQNTQNMSNVIVIGNIIQGIKPGQSATFEGKLFCNIDYDNMKVEITRMEESKIRPGEFDIPISTIEKGIKSDEIRLYVINDIHTLEKTISDILAWQGRP